MKNKKLSILIGSVLALAVIISTVPPLVHTEAADVTVELVNPKGAIEAPQLIPLTERLGTLEGKRIAFVGYSKDPGTATAASYASSVADLLHEKYGRLSAENPTGVELILTNSSAWGDVLGEKGVFAYDTYVRGAAATSTNPPGVDAIIAGVAN